MGPHRRTGTLVPGRECGPCTACCRVLEIEALDKPAGTLCAHNTGASCGIYRERPDACARWHCLWRRIAALPADLRPDRSGVMFSLDSRAPVAGAPDGACIVGRAVDGVEAFARWEAVEAFAMFVGEGSLPVWRAYDRAATLMYPGPDDRDRR
jgi:hypothetical protein